MQVNSAVSFKKNSNQSPNAVVYIFIADETKKEDSTKDGNVAKNDTANKKQPDPPKSPSKNTNKPEPPKSPAKNKPPPSESIDTANLLKEAKAKADTASTFGASILKSPLKSNNKNKNNKGQSGGKRYVYHFCTHYIVYQLGVQVRNMKMYFNTEG